MFVTCASQGFAKAQVRAPRVGSSWRAVGADLGSATLSFVKLARIWLLVLLAVLLPLRGAMAAAMMCPPPASPHGMSAATQGDARGHHHDMALARAHAGHHGDSLRHHENSAVQNDCSLCAACCLTVPLTAAAPTLPERHDGAPSFPELAAPPPSFLSGGLERPPRSI